MKYWVTQYALTRGILEVEGERSVVSPTMIVVLLRDDTGHVYRTSFHGDNWHSTEAAAKKHANEMIEARMKSLRKSMAKLEKLRF